MNGSLSRPLSLDSLKDQARRLRASLSSDGKPISHSGALELLAHQLGYKDWNTLHAALGNGPPAWPARLGDRVRGEYLGQAFEGEVVGVQSLPDPNRFRVTLRFDAPVDVVAFDSFSNWRQRVSCIVDGSGSSIERTSDKRPHLRLVT